MFELFYEAAVRRASALGLTPDTLIQSHDLVCGAMGTAWVDEQAAIVQRPGVRLGLIHPLFRSLRSGSDPDLISVAELAVYLKSFMSDPKIANTISNLRPPDKYISTLFEVAMAHRWKGAGADVLLEPATPGGLADFGARISGTDYVIECGSFPGDVFKTDVHELVQFLVPVANKYLDLPYSFTLEIRIEKHTPGDFFGDVRRAVVEAAHQFQSNQKDVTVQALFGSVRVRRTDLEPLKEKDWDVAARASMHEPNADGSLYGVHTNPEVRESCWICVSMPRPPHDAYDQIARKFRHEYDQLSGVEQPRIVLIDVTGLTFDALHIDMRRVSDSVGRELLDRPKASEIWLLSRGLSDRERFQYHAIVLNNPNAIVPVPARFFEKLTEREMRFDMLTGSEFERQ